MWSLFIQSGVVRSEAEWSLGLADIYVSPDTLEDADLQTARGLPGPPRCSRGLSLTSTQLSDLPVVKAAEAKLAEEVTEDDGFVSHPAMHGELNVLFVRLRSRPGPSLHMFLVRILVSSTLNENLRLVAAQ